MLVKAVVWRESRFDPKKARQPWRARPDAGHRNERPTSGARKQDRRFSIRINFSKPKTNLEGRHLDLHRAMEHWTHQSDPIPFALAEYNGRRQFVPIAGAVEMALPRYRNNGFFKRSISGNAQDTSESIIDRYKFYQRRGRM